MPADPYVDAILAHGDPSMRASRGELVSRSQELDSLPVEYLDPSATAYALRSTISDYPYMPIVERRRRHFGSIYKFNLLLEGLADETETWREMSLDEQQPEEGWDQINRTIVTRGDPDAAAWSKGARIYDADITGVTAEADDDKLTKVAHGLVTGQIFKITFASGFGGLTSGNEYYAIRIDDDNIKAATTAANAAGGTAIDISSDGTDATITPVTVGYENLYIADRAARKHRAAGYHEVQMVLKGLKGTKPYKRRINGQAVSAVSTFDGAVILSASIWSGWPPVDSGSDNTLSGADIEVESFTSEVTVADTVICVGDPPTDKIGMPWIPPDPPDIVIIDLSGSFVAEKRFWPSGWVCVSMPTERLAIATGDMWLVTVNYAFRPDRMPTREPVVI